MRKKIWIPLISGLIAALLLLSPALPQLSQISAQFVAQPGQSLGEILHPSSNPFANRFSDVKDIRTATFVVAASDSEHKFEADYYCNGSDDHVEINAALNALPTSGGRVVLSEGTFTIDDPITFPANSLTLEGQGRSTFIDGDGLATNEHAIVVSERNHCTIRNLAVQTEDGGGKTSHCIYLEYAGDYLTIDGVVIVNSDSDGIQLYDVVNRLIIKNCRIENADGRGIAIYVPVHSTITDNIICGTGDTAISIYGSGADGVTITNNIITNVHTNGIYVNEGNYLTISHNYITGNTVTDAISLYWPLLSTIVGNTIFNIGQQHGISCEYATKCVIADNTISYTKEHGIYVFGGGGNCTIDGNCLDHSDGDGIRANNVAGYNFTNNLVVTCTDGIHFEDKVDNCLVAGNYCENNSGYGIDIATATCDNNTVKNNKLVGNTAGCFLDSGTGTMLDAYVVPFSDGTDPQDSGFLIDLDTEYARAWLRLPAEVQQVVRMKIYARAGVLSAAAMRLEINVNGGADNEAYNTHATAAPNTPSTSTNFAADDVIFWTLTSAEIVALLGGDTVEVKVLHEAAGDGDVATNAYIRTVEIEYV